MSSKEDVELFLAESEGLINKVETEISNFEKNSEDLKPILQLYYVFNGLTQLINPLNLKNLMDFNQHIESMLEKLKDKEIPKKKINQFINLMYDNLDELKLVIDKLKRGDFEDLPSDDLAEFQTKIEDFEREYEITFIEPIPLEKINLLVRGKKYYQISIRLKDTCKFKRVRIFFIFRALNNIGRICHSKPEPEVLEKGDIEFEFEVYFLSEKNVNEITKVLNEILEIDSKFIKEISFEKFKKIIQKFSLKLLKEKEELLDQIHKLKGSDEIGLEDNISNFITELTSEGISSLEKDRTNIFYKIYIRFKITCKFKTLRLYLIFRTLSNIGQISCTNPDPKVLDRGDFDFDFELYFTSKKSKIEISEKLEELQDIAIKVVREISSHDYIEVVKRLCKKVEVAQKPEEEIIVEKSIIEEQQIGRIRPSDAKVTVPIVIYTYEFSNINDKIFVPNLSFIKLIEAEDVKSVYSCEGGDDVTKFYLYIVKNGLIFATIAQESVIFKDFFNIYEKGFTNLQEFLEANKFGIESYIDYLDFKTSKYYNKNADSYHSYLANKNKTVIKE